MPGLSIRIREGKNRLVIITNTTKLPDVVEDWANDDQYRRGTADFTVTELIKPPRVLALERVNKDNIERDITDLVWRLSGQAKHVIFQRVAALKPDRYIAEERVTMAVAGVTLSGQLDLYDRSSKTLMDYKESKVWKKILGDSDEWEAQSNMNAFLIRMILNLPVEHLVNIVIFKDWSIRESFRNKDYPPSPIKAWPLKRWDQNRVLLYIQDRVAKHLATTTGQLPLCSPKERWTRPEKYAVMKKGRKSAVKLFDDRGEANAWMVQNKRESEELHVDKRKGEDTRCLFYCDVAAFCDHGRQVLAEAQNP
jgi:hypothetical protein